MKIKRTKKRKDTYEQLIFELDRNGYDQQFYKDHVDEYMNYYDSLQVLNQRLLGDCDYKTYNEVLKEKRQVTKEMRSILAFLKLKPSDEGGDGNANEFDSL